jgi:adenylosuccinate lyase
MVQRCAMAAQEGKGSFRELLGNDPDVSARLDQAQLDAAFDLDHHLRHTDLIFRRALGE